MDVVVGLDNGGNANKPTVLDARGRFLVDELLEMPSRVLEGPGVAVEALAHAFANVLEMTGVTPSAVRGVGLDTPGPASADGVISSKGSTNFSMPAWRGFDIRGALEARLGLPVVYSNDGNAAALYAHHVHFGADAPRRSSVSVVVGTGLGGGLVESGRVVRGAAGMAGELGHVIIPLDGILEADQSLPACNCGNVGDAESIASLSAIERNLLPYWLTRYPDHELAGLEAAAAAKLVRGHAEKGDALGRAIFAQQAMALGRLFTLVSNVTDPDAYFIGGGVVETTPELRKWFVDLTTQHTNLREEQLRVASFAEVPDLDMAGARGAALAAWDQLRHA
ncbi:MAG TPA: ROK family protein [Frankiaceae bacterium]|jgi:predicted NBD/HSP70 family sugar kinase|nr:ROK family protein [Frankiaceae bacterium]